MNKYLKSNEWCIIEDGFNPKNHQASESIFSIGNGKMGQRANFEEKYSGTSLQGSYIAGVYYPDKTRVGWWKNGYPEYFAKVLNSPNWIGININIKGEDLDLFTCQVENFIRILDMRHGLLIREFNATLKNKLKVHIKTQRFVSMDNTEIGVLKYEITPLNFSENIEVTPFLDGDIKNEDSNYDEKFWNITDSSVEQGSGYLEAQTKKLDFRCGFSMHFKITENDNAFNSYQEVLINRDDYVGNKLTLLAKQGETITIEKFAGITSTLNHSATDLKSSAIKLSSDALEKGFTNLFDAHKKKWDEKWLHSDIKIKGDIAAQQAIRFNIFHLNQTYTGEDERLNIGPKGFTGEKYGGTTYWDTEAYCIPFFLMTSPSFVTRQLLIYRYNHLQKAIENAKKLGFNNGAALYPMVTANGEECHNEWEITFEEIHRNGAIAFAIHNYIRHTGDYKYLEEYGLEVLIGISRFWSQRVSFSEEKNKFVILGVTGPNEYENNVNNNWYTNKIAVWCLKYTQQSIAHVQSSNSEELKRILKKLNFNTEVELVRWKEICETMHFPYNNNFKVFMQQDGFMDKEQILTNDIAENERPINQHWSWDRILRSPFIKQADTLQGIYLFDDEFTKDEIIRNFDFYEPRTVHESSLSPCVHSVIAAKIDRIDKAYEMYLRTARLDLDDYNAEVHEGLHITSMAGTWMSVVEGFGGKRVYDQKLYLNPKIPSNWEEYSFRLRFKENDIEIVVNKQNIKIHSLAEKAIDVIIYNNNYKVEAFSELNISV